jgi:choline-glycine betaine transporter
MYKPRESLESKNYNKYEPVQQPFKLYEPNSYRKAVQALDLMSLHYGIHGYKRPTLAVALLALMHMQTTRLLIINQQMDIG